MAKDARSAEDEPIARECRLSRRELERAIAWKAFQKAGQCTVYYPPTLAPSSRSDLKFSSSIANTVHTLPAVPQLFFWWKDHLRQKRRIITIYCPKWKHDDVANLLYCVSRGEAVNSRLPLEAWSFKERGCSNW